MRHVLTGIATFAMLMAGCDGGELFGRKAPGTAQSAATSEDGAGGAPDAYQPASGELVVHEWGTFTHVAATDGSLQPGLHHEEEDLPGFVADRMAQAAATPNVVQKMETPVTYFYAPSPMTVNVRVEFPRGLFTQWYPYVKQLNPPVYFGMNGPDVVDPWLMLNASIPAHCSWKYEGDVKGGLLDWGDIELLDPDSKVDLAGPLGDTTWGFSRNTKANPLRVMTGDIAHHEKFLFYRGLGNFDAPLRIAGKDASVTLQHANVSTDEVRGALVMNVTATGAAFTLLPAVKAGEELEAAVPAPSMPLGEFVPALKDALREVLVSDGLYTDEAQAMVDTWERSYFLTPGIRVLYLMPRSQTDAIIPLTVSPAPAKTVRTMVVRVEVMTPALEKELSAALVELSVGDGSAGRARFLGYGRFAEPYLTRAIALSGVNDEKLAGEALLTEIRANQKWAPLFVE